MTRAETARQIEELGAVAVIRLRDPGRLRQVVDALAKGGLKALEVTMTVPGAVEAIRALSATLPRGFLLGAGTVLDAETARQVILAGARFVVSPVLRRELVTLCHRYDVLAVPGTLTPTEILTAWEQGVSLVKVFPATSLGPGFVKDVLGPLPQVKLVPTGGITLDNAGEWIRAGAAAVGIGSALLDKAAIAEGRWEVIANNARRLVESVAAARAGAAGRVAVRES